MQAFGDYSVQADHEYPECSLRILRLTPGQTTGAHLHRRCMQSYLVLEGRVEVQVGDVYHNLAPGEAVRVPIGAIHTARPVDGVAVVVSVSVPPLRAEDHIPVTSRSTPERQP
jgi:mannose-6-phosphate isomerase-like protein (cupin superfamily)